ncbi:MAG TPA: phosphotransferase [Candidatus Binatia bacterium]|nr:phosphotransferase [Candidatus Binatia bacterium]
MTPNGGRHRAPAPAWIGELLAPAQVSEASRLGWGFRNESWKVVLAGGQEIAVTRLADAEAASSISTLTRLVGARLRAAGVPTPAVIETGGATTAPIMLTEFVAGTAGAALLDEPGGSGVVGSVLGATWRRLAAVNPAGLPISSTWAAADVLVASSVERLDRAAPRLAGPERRQVAAAIDSAGVLLAGRPPGFVHGDLVPVNIVVRDRALAALLDFEFARIADPLLDAAWFDCILAFHHPADEPIAWRAFVASAGLDDREPATHDLLRVLPIVRLLELLDEDRGQDDSVAHWIRVLRAWLARPP